MNIETGEQFFVKFYITKFNKNDVMKSAIKKVKIRIYKTIILPMVIYVCETSSLTLREDVTE
jgi:hypothetical protein